MMAGTLRGRSTFYSAAECGRASGAWTAPAPFAVLLFCGDGIYSSPMMLGGGRVPMVAVLIDTQVRNVLNWGSPPSVRD
jgi:hypothetical protein